MSSSAADGTETPAAVVELHGFQKVANSPSTSGFCQKLEVYLRATNTAYRDIATYPHTSPTGKLPCARLPNGELVADSHFIIRALISNKVSRDLDASLSPAQTAETRAWQAYIEDKLYPCVVYERWYVDENYAKIAQQITEEVPWPAKFLVPRYFRSRIRGLLQSWGLAARGEEQVKGMIRQAMADLEARLGGKDYFHGTGAPTELDVIVSGFLMNMLDSVGNPWACEAVLKDCPGLVALTRRMTEELFPEYRGLLDKLQAPPS